MTRECDVCGVEPPPSSPVKVGDDRVCSECHDALSVDGAADTTGTKSTDDPALDAFADAVKFSHEQLDRPIGDHHSSEHADRPDTGREYFECVRGWNAETVDAKRLDWAPADETALLDYLMGEGDDRDAIRGNGLFTEDLTPFWQGLYVFPYFPADGRPVYAISRSSAIKSGMPMSRPCCRPNTSSRSLSTTSGFASRHVAHCHSLSSARRSSSCVWTCHHSRVSASPTSREIVLFCVQYLLGTWHRIPVIEYKQQRSSECVPPRNGTTPPNIS